MHILENIAIESILQKHALAPTLGLLNHVSQLNCMRSKYLYIRTLASAYSNNAYNVYVHNANIKFINMLCLCILRIRMCEKRL